VDGWMEPWILNVQVDQITSVTTDLADLEGDPHVWLSPSKATQMVENIAEAVSKTDPENAQIYTRNAVSLKERLAKLDQDFQLILVNCKRRDFVTAHEAFGYLAQSYGLEQIAISGITPEAEPSLKELTQITRIVQEKQIKYIFFEDLVSPKLAQTLASEVGANTLVLNPIEGLTDEQARDGKDYFSEMRSNLQNLKIALECN
ncbi:MAG: zinc ABC transporter substrate-binding protein, partial [Patescibacteria group bacterium]